MAATHRLTLLAWLSPRGLTTACLGLAAALAAPACSDPAEPCDPPIPPGARYQVTLGAETQNSDKCHIVDSVLPVFTVTAAEAQADLGRQACYTTPAAEAPPQQSVSLLSCKNAESEQLGLFCQMKYPSTCDGTVYFFFDAPVGAPAIDWSAPVIDAVFKIRDHATGCISAPSNCTDEYQARLQRVQ